MNVHILENAAIYVNSYRAACEKRGTKCDNTTLRGHVARLFGAVYAAMLIQ